MIIDKGLIKVRTPGLVESHPTYKPDVDLMILGDAVHALYQVDDTDEYKEEFGWFNSVKLKFYLDVHIYTRPQDSKLNDLFYDCDIGDADYSYHVKSNDWRVRALVAMNGAYLPRLARDPDARVRREVVDWVTRRHEKGYGDDDFYQGYPKQRALMFKRFIPLSLNLGDISYIDAMVTDEDEWVRYSIARLGITRHIEALIDDPSDYVRMAVAHNGQEHHLQHLINDPSWKVLKLIACNQNATLEQLHTVAHNTKQSVVFIDLIHRGVFFDFFVENSKNSRVKTLAARLGHCHEYLSRDKDYFVRLVVARHTTDISILNRLANDEDYSVRASVAEHTTDIDILNRLVNDKAGNVSSAAKSSLAQLANRSDTSTPVDAS